MPPQPTYANQPRVEIPSYKGTYRIKNPRIQVPHWRELDKMEKVPRHLALELREQIFLPTETGIILLSDPNLKNAIAAQSPLPKICMDMESDPPEIEFIMQDGTRVSEIEFIMQDGTRVSQNFGLAYSDRLISKIESALNWERSMPFESRTGRVLNTAPNRNVHVPTDAEVFKQASKPCETERRKAIHDAMMDAEQAEAKAKEARRKYQAALSRAARATAPPKPYTPRQEPPKSAKKRKLQERAAKRAGKSKELYTVATLEHQVHTLPKQQELRANRFDEKQAVEHAEKVARLAREKVDRLRKLEADASAMFEAATHVVASPPTVSDIVSAAMVRVGF